VYQRSEAPPEAGVQVAYPPLLQLVPTPCICNPQAAGMYLTEQNAGPSLPCCMAHAWAMHGHGHDCACMPGPHGTQLWGASLPARVTSPGQSMATLGPGKEWVPGLQKQKQI